MELQDDIRKSVVKQMTLRDWFAGMALSGTLAGDRIWVGKLSTYCYECADDMIRARGEVEREWKMNLNQSK